MIDLSDELNSNTQWKIAGIPGAKNTSLANTKRCLKLNSEILLTTPLRIFILSPRPARTVQLEQVNHLAESGFFSISTGYQKVRSLSQ
jgi:hypothetical protein